MKKYLLFLIPICLFAQQVSNRDYAGLRADVDALREQQKALVAEILSLRHELQQKDAKIQKAIAMVDALDKRMGENDAAWKKQISEIYKALDTEHNARVQESKRIEQSQPKPSAGGEYAILVVKKGDTLGLIAKMANTTIHEIKRINNMKNDTIYEGQKLKVPVVK